MFNNLDYTYNDENSIIHRINPLIKFIGLFIYILVCLFKYDNILFILNLSLVFILILLSNISFLRYLKIVWKLKYIIIIIYFMLYHYGMELIDINIIVFKLIFLILYIALIIYTTTKEDIGRGLARIINIFNLIGINIKKISSFITNIITFIIIYIDTMKEVINSGENKGIVYSHSNILNKIKLVFINLKRVYKDCKNKMRLRKSDMKYKLYNGNIISKYKYRTKLAIFDYAYILMNIGLIIYYVLKVR